MDGFGEMLERALVYRNSVKNSKQGDEIEMLLTSIEALKQIKWSLQSCNKYIGLARTPKTRPDGILF